MNYSNKNKRIVIIFLVLAGLLLISLLFTSVPKEMKRYSFINSINKSKLVIFTPPSNGGIPQPYDIGDNTGNGNIYKLDFKSGARMGIASGPHQGLVLYQYKYSGIASPDKNCTNLYVGYASRVLSCPLQTTTASGNKIYLANSEYNSTSLFVIMEGTVILLSNPVEGGISKDMAIEVLDQLAPAEGKTLLNTLVKNNPIYYSQVK